MNHPTRLYVTWTNMRSRCRNPSRPDWKRYGGRGITICEAWQTFAGFREWAESSGYADGLTIDRIDVDGNYEPGNCEWVTLSENIRRSHETRWSRTPIVGRQSWPPLPG